MASRKNKRSPTQTQMSLLGQIRQISSLSWPLPGANLILLGHFGQLVQRNHSRLNGE